MAFQIEVKINIAGGIDDALRALGERPAGMSTRHIWFAADPQGVAEERLPLSDSGVVIRFRSSADKDDLTVKLRPCLESQLLGRWREPFKVETDTDKLKYRIEGDWSGTRQVLAASLVSTGAPGSLLDAVAAGGNAAKALKTIQWQFLETCAVPPLHVQPLTALGPIASTTWTDLALGGLEVNLERWQAAELDFLEASIRVAPEDAESDEEFEARALHTQQEFTMSVRERGIAIAQDLNNKTQRVLKALVAAARHPV
jgi:hypothetical protein